MKIEDKAKEPVSAQKEGRMLHYLTVQDVIWINTQVTKTVNEFRYAPLEEATFYQYGYGKSEDVLQQAGNFLRGFLRFRPFSRGNLGTGFIAVLTFLSINGFSVNIEPEDVPKWLGCVISREKEPIEAIREIAVPSGKPTELRPFIRVHVMEHIQRFSSILSQLDS